MVGFKLEKQAKNCRTGERDSGRIEEDRFVMSALPRVGLLESRTCGIRTLAGLARVLKRKLISGSFLILLAGFDRRFLRPLCWFPLCCSFPQYVTSPAPVT
jgi:hypothetical protein